MGDSNMAQAMTLIKNVYAEELKHMGIYDIPNASDIPPTFEIQDDVEIITNEFEKEQQDMIERRR